MYTTYARLSARPASGAGRALQICAACSGSNADSLAWADRLMADRKPQFTSHSISCTCPSPSFSEQQPLRKRDAQLLINCHAHGIQSLDSKPSTSMCTARNP